MAYIEPIDCDCNCCNNDQFISRSESDSKINMDRWNDVIGNWDNMSFEERIALFTPRVEFIRIPNSSVSDISSNYSKEIANTVYKSCRNVDNISFDIDRNTIPTILVTLSGINYTKIPNADIRSKVTEFVLKYIIH